MTDSQRLHDESIALVDRLADRLPAADLATFRSLHDVGEPIYLLNLLCAGLLKWRTPITGDERDALAALLTDLPIPQGRYPFLDDPGGTLAALNVAG